MARVLVIDDSKIIRDLLTDFLTDSDHEVVVAIDGISGVEMARSSQFDLCICDMHLPRMNGWQVLAQLEDIRERTQFIFTDSLPDQSGENIHNSTPYPLLRKPFDLDQLRQAISNTLSKVHAS